MAAANAGLLPTQVYQPALVQQRLIAQPQALAYAQPQALAYAQPRLAIAQPQIAVAQPVLAKQVVEEYDANPQYSFSYDVQDSLTGDSKSQQETRSGDVVQGQYSLIDADGLQRIVSYTADSVNGFNAVVQREPLAAKAVVAKAVVAQPIVKSIVAQPAAYVAQPAAYVAQPQYVQPQLVRSAYAAAPVAYSQPIVRTVAHY